MKRDQLSDNPRQHILELEPFAILGSVTAY